MKPLTHKVPDGTYGYFVHTNSLDLAAIVFQSLGSKKHKDSDNNIIYAPEVILVICLMPAILESLINEISALFKAFRKEQKINELSYHPLPEEEWMAPFSQQSYREIETIHENKDSNISERVKNFEKAILCQLTHRDYITYLYKLRGEIIHFKPEASPIVSNKGYIEFKYSHPTEIRHFKNIKHNNEYVVSRSNPSISDNKSMIIWGGR